MNPRTKFDLGTQIRLGQLLFRTRVAVLNQIHGYFKRHYNYEGSLTYPPNLERDSDKNVAATTTDMRTELQRNELEHEELRMPHFNRAGLDTDRIALWSRSQHDDV